MGLGSRILALDWAPLCLGTRLLGVSAATRGGVDSASLGPCSRRLGLCRWSLGLIKISRDIGCPIVGALMGAPCETLPDVQSQSLGCALCALGRSPLLSVGSPRPPRLFAREASGE